MFVYLFAGLDALFYLCAMPVSAAFFIDTRRGLRFGAGISAFGTSAALRRARKNSGKPAGRTNRPGLRRLLPLLRRLRGVRLTLRGRLNLGDAAVTALACGALQALATALTAHAGGARVDVAPAFGTAAPEVALTGMLSLRAGHIIAAAARSGADNVSRRILKWTDTPSKAS